FIAGLGLPGGKICRLYLGSLLRHHGFQQGRNPMSINKIGGPGGIKPGAPKRSSGTGSTGGTSFSSLLKPAEKPTGQIGQTAPVAALDAMLTVQSVDDPGGGNRRNRQRAFERGSG